MNSVIEPRSEHILKDDRETRIVSEAWNLLSEIDMKVSEIAFRYLEDIEGGYGQFVDGTESMILLAHGWLLQKLTGAESHSDAHLSPWTTGSDPRVPRLYRLFLPAEGKKSQNVLSGDYDPPSSPEDTYEGLNLDDECAVAELVQAAATAYSLLGNATDDTAGGKKYIEQAAELIGASRGDAEPFYRRSTELNVDSQPLLAWHQKHTRFETVWS